ncbi:MAG: phosphohydrolase [Candidatus Thorarchaeota archaeon]|nr:MAG: phosphohydrolase [Candidatus Thorarchaeota archaeon]
MKSCPEEKLEKFVKQSLAVNAAGAHTYDHIMRVYLLAKMIGTGIGADMRVLGAAALLHDVGRPRETETGVSHSILSGEMSREVLIAAGYTQDEVKQIDDAIRTHRFSEGLTPTSKEGEVLSDADKLDAIGAIGVFRAVSQAAAEDRGMEGFLRHADEKLLKLHRLMYTKSGKALAKRRNAFLQEFVNRLREESRY